MRGGERVGIVHIYKIVVFVHKLAHASHKLVYGDEGERREQTERTGSGTC